MWLYFCAKSGKEKYNLINSILIPVASFLDKKMITTDADVIGIIFPVYYGELPIIIKEFSGKLENLCKKSFIKQTNMLADSKIEDLVSVLLLILME